MDIYNELQRHTPPPDPDQKIERIIKHARALQTKISKLQSERYDILDFIGQCQYFDLDKKDAILDMYDDKINETSDEYQQIKNRLDDLGYCV